MKVSQNDIINFNELYFKYKNYAEVARQTGFSASTVKKYIQKDYMPREERSIITFSIDDIPQDFDVKQFKCEDWGTLCCLNEDEILMLEDFRKEIMI